MERFEQHKRFHQGNGEISFHQSYESSKIKSVSRPKSIKTGRKFLREEEKQEEQGNLNVRKRVEALEIVSDSSSCSNHSIEEDSFSYKLRRTYSKQASEAPMKKLLEEELSREMETRRRPPSVIARLMGLDALPPQQPIKKQHKKFSENYQKKTASIGYLDKRSSYEGRSSRRSNSQPEEFKDVFEVVESSTSNKHPNLLQEGMANLHRNENELEFVRQTFMDVKRLSTDEKLQQSKEYHDALDVLYSNKELLLKFLQEPDSLFTKHLHDLHGPSPPQPGHIRVLQSSNAHGDLRTKIGKSSEQNHGASSIQKHEQGTTHRKNVYIPSKVSKYRVHEKDDTCQLPTRIVVLKPNLKKVQNAVRPLSSPESLGGFHSGHKKKKKFGSSENFDIFQDVEHQRNSTFDVELVKHTTQGSREIAKEITRQMRHSVSSGSKMVPSLKLRGYAGDESSCSLSENESANDDEEKTTASRYINDLKNRYSPSSSYSTESSVSREAKKRLSERWKMSHRTQEVRKASRGSTLGEMLALPDRETMLKSYDSVGPDGFSDSLARNGGVTRCATPLGISSRDGWKDECVRSLPRSRSLPASSTCLNSPKTSIRYRTPEKDRCALPKESINWHSNTSRKLDSEQRDGFLLRSSIKSFRKKSSYSSCGGGEENHLVQVSGQKPDEQIYEGGEKPHLVQDTDLKCVEQRYQCGEKSDLVQDVDLKPDKSRVSFEGVDLSEWKASIIDIPVDDPSETTTSVNERELFAENSNPENTPLGPSEGSSIFSHCAITEVESPASSKEAGQPSPISVLEPPFVEESSSSSDSFEKISADLHGLRMQLQLLKQESSDAYSEGSEMIVSSDEDIREGCRDLPRENRGLNICDKVNRDFSYMIDVLVDSGFNDADLDVLSQAWYSPESPVSPSVFDKLEKKYEEHMSWPRSDRKLLFDRINMGLMELLELHMDPHPWVRLEKPIGLQWRGQHLAEDLWTLLVRHCNEVKKISLEMALMNEMKWSDFGDDINMVGNGIERLLFDELVTEAVIT
ncbi:hypothetical protein AQUCO_02700231v1 [Aquilegia coerulea]|uniref:DUF4378 domain-containing protein n=1 Tax=Aquilegia coerulea TaxID=218851 RepID=A0A2G5D5T2_AQUCA|nr:hypothetical protein AQUCO_02700231v1 [Aquilegia coerulea]